MDKSWKRAREGKDSAAAAVRGKHRRTASEVAAELEEELVKGTGAIGEDEPWQHPPGVFKLPWQKYRGGLGVIITGSGWEHHELFFKSLVDGSTATIGVPGDRLMSPIKWNLFEEVNAWLATAGDGEVDPVWRSVLEGRPKPAA